MPWVILLLCPGHSWLSPSQRGLGGDREGCEEINVLLCVNFSHGDGIDGLGKDFVNFFIK